MSENRIQPHAFWLYGVIVGLAIKQALEGVFPHIFSLEQGQEWWPEAFRLFVFLTLIVRFYLGAAIFFGRAYGDDSIRSGYSIDFLFGFVHFLFFYGLAMTIDIHGKSEWPFRVLMLVVLGYDLLWVAFSKKRELIRVWAFWNVITILAAGVGYLVPDRLAVRSVCSEAVALVIVFIASFLDIGQVITENDWFSNWLKKISGGK